MEGKQMWIRADGGPRGGDQDDIIEIAPADVTSVALLGQQVADYILAREGVEITITISQWDNSK